MSDFTHTIMSASQALASLDSDWAELIDTIGPCKFESKNQQEPYEALVRAVAYQQLHTKAGDAILEKLIKYFGQFPEPQQLLVAEFDNLRACGFSGRKIQTLKSIAEATQSGLVPTLQTAKAMTNEMLIERLITIKGIGRWTVEMLLVFTMERMDILPADDFAIVEGYKRLKKLDVSPTRKEIAEIGKAWSPYRSIASWYLWRVPK